MEVDRWQLLWEDIVYDRMVVILVDTGSENYSVIV